MSAPEYIGPVCRHVCLECGGCDICCACSTHECSGHDRDDAEPEEEQ